MVVTKVPQHLRDQKDQKVQLHLQDQKDQKDLLHRQDLKVLKGLKDLKVIKVLRVLKVIHQLVTKEDKDHKVIEVILEPQVILHKAVSDQQVIQYKETLGRLVIIAKVLVDQQVLQDQQETVVIKGLLHPQVLRGQKDLLHLQDRKVQKDQ
jgi:hypothetical protein